MHSFFRPFRYILLVFIFKTAYLQNKCLIVWSGLIGDKIRSCFERIDDVWVGDRVDDDATNVDIRLVLGCYLLFLEFFDKTSSQLLRADITEDEAEIPISSSDR